MKHAAAARLADLTPAETEWFKVHSLIDRGYTYCVECNTIIEPIYQEKKHLLEMGEPLGNAIIHGERTGYRALACPMCGAHLAGYRTPEKKEKAQQICSVCDRDWPDHYRHCAVCGGRLSEDPSRKLQDAARKAQRGGDDGWQEYLDAFAEMFGRWNVPDETADRLRKLSTDPAYAGLIGTTDPEGREIIRSVMAGG